MMKKLLLLSVFVCTQLPAQIGFDPGPNYNHRLEPYTLTLSGTGTIRYTLDGSDPTNLSPSGINSVTIPITQNVTVKAVIFSSSPVYTEKYYVGPLPIRNVFFKPPPSYSSVCILPAMTEPKTWNGSWVDFFPPGYPMSAVCQGWYRATASMDEGSVEFNNCIPGPGALSTASFFVNSDVFYDYSSGMITNPPACLLVTDEDYRKTVMVKVYPNPVDHELHLTTDLKISSYEIIDLSGRLFRKENLRGKKLNVSGLVKGNYLVKLIRPDGDPVFLQFIKK